MKYLLTLLCLTIFTACNRGPEPVANANSERPMRSEQMQTVTAHTTENQTPKPTNSSGGKWSQSGDPIDTTDLDTAIAVAEKEVRAKPSDSGAKKALAQAYFDRGLALTNARQYASAIGDYRRALKHDPTHEESKKWIGQIVSIYEMLKKQAPEEGEEPPPLPFKKAA